MSHVHGGSSPAPTMDMSSGGSMAMTFFNAIDTPLYSTAWTPSSRGAYAGTVIFLIILSVTLRGLFAAKHNLEARWYDQAVKRKYVIVADERTNEEQKTSADADAKAGVLTTNGLVEDIRVLSRQSRSIQPWRFSVDLPRALLVTCIVGVGYLLMLAVMTFNLGYFLGVLAGAFIGELIFGRYGELEHHH